MKTADIPGLTKNESLVYISLLQIKKGGATKISEKCGLFRTLVYDILIKLAEKGLVSYSKKEGKRIYRAASPNRLLELQKEKEKEISKAVEELNAIFEKPSEEVSVDLFEGVAGMKAITEDIIDHAIKGKAKEFFFLGPLGSSWDVFGNYLIHTADKVKTLALLRKIDLRVIWNPDIESKEMRKLFGGKKNHRTFPKDIGHTNPFIVYGDKVVINGGQSKPFTIIIQNKESAESFRNYFKFIWKRTKEQ